MLPAGSSEVNIYRRDRLKKGFVKKLISNQYTLVDLTSRKELIASARGKLRHMRIDEDSSFNRQTTKRTKKENKVVTISPKVGDIVYYDDQDQILIIDVLPRKNELERPDVANIDQVLLVFSVVRPDFSFHLLDKFLVILDQEHLPVVLVISKIDLIDDDQMNTLKDDLSYYETMGFEMHYVNSKERIGFDVLTTIFTDKITVLAGQTGVGKSTLLNALMPELQLKTQETSHALGRGKHTTRHTELYEFGGGYIADTPGFSKIDFRIFEPEMLKDCYPDFIALASSCRFGNKCLHQYEPGCAVREATEQGKIPAWRLEHYLAFLEDIKTQKPKY